MSEEAVRCSKCGGVVTGDTCNACGATGQALKCEHCGANCPGDAHWCPSCGRRMNRPGAAGESGQEQVVPAGANLGRLVMLFGLIVVACILIWKFAPAPVPTALTGLAVLFAAAPGSAWRRLNRITPLLLGTASASLIFNMVAPHPPQIIGTTLRTATCDGVTTRTAPADPAIAAAPGMVLARFQDGGVDADRIESDVKLPKVQNWYMKHFSETINPDTHDVTIQFDERISVDFVIDSLKHDPAVVFAEPDYIYHALYTPNDPYYDEPYDSREGPIDQWYLPKIGAPEAWDKLKGVQSKVRVAIIDTGIDYTHPDLKNLMARDSKGAMVGKCFIRGRNDFLDDNGHGTHCAGIANAETDNGTGVAGVGFNSFRLVAAKVLTGRGYGQMDWIANAITWCADNGCKVESMSLGGGGYSQAMQDSINYAWKKKVVVVAAAGNSSTATPGYPAGNNHVVAVSATGRDDRLAFFSNYGTPIAVGAPGVSILATMPTYECDLSRRGLKLNYDSLQGTSMACPVVAGTFGALFAFQPSLSPGEAVQRVQQTADNTAGAPNGGWEVQFGHGRVNLANAILDRARPSAVGSFYGQVTDKKGRAIAAASVTCSGRLVQTHSDGMFRIANLAAGSYPIEVVCEGKTTKIKADIVTGADTLLTVETGG